jgi:hypothetical protein
MKILNKMFSQIQQCTERHQKDNNVQTSLDLFQAYNTGPIFKNTAVEYTTLIGERRKTK